MDLGLKGKVAVVTGGGSGIGLSAVHGLLDEGAHVVVADRDVETLRGLGVHTLELDLLEPNSPSRLVQAAIDEHGRVDIVVNALGVAFPRQGFVAISDQEWDATLGLNFYCMLRTTRAALQHMAQREGGGAIVSVASDMGREPDPFLVDYAVAKAAVISLSKAISLEYARVGIRSNVVTPGPTRTPGFVAGLTALAEEWGMGTEEAIDHYVDIRKLPRGRPGTPEDVAAVILFLASEAAANVTGADYRVEGGLIRSA